MIIFDKFDLVFENIALRNLWIVFILIHKLYIYFLQKTGLSSRVSSSNGIQANITQMLSMLMTEECVKHVTFHGKNNKIGLKNMKIYEIMKEVLRTFNQESEENFDEYVSASLRRLKSRFSMAKKRERENKTKFLN